MASSQRCLSHRSSFAHLSLSAHSGGDPLLADLERRHRAAGRPNLLCHQRFCDLPTHTCRRTALWVGFVDWLLLPACLPYPAATLSVSAFTIPDGGGGLDYRRQQGAGYGGAVSNQYKIAPQ